MKKIICVLAVCLLLAGCDGGLVGQKMTEPPQIVVSASDVLIDYEVVKDKWGKNIYDRPGDVDILMQTDIGVFPPDSEITVDFGENTPDSAEVIITDIKMLATGYETAVISEKAYEPFEGLLSLKEDTTAEGYDLRMFVIKAKWGEKYEASYIFAMRTPASAEKNNADDEYSLECEYYLFSAGYNAELSAYGGAKIFDTYEAYNEFCSRYGISVGEGSLTEETFGKNNVIVVFDYDSPSPAYRQPETVIKRHRLTVTKYDETDKITDSSIVTRGYVIVISKDTCRVFDIDDDSDLYYIWGRTDMEE
ncbi:MAG: hypothetical protein E7218_02220 [Anaerofustis stercorihominis]|nr:hypothetical protein [Anaerofustis stercorihominis]